MSKISVIIPVKNRANLLPFTLDNIISQSLPPTEIIVVDDGSVDDINSVIEKYKHSVSFIKNEGTGPGAARNTGLKASTGNYIQFFDSDDLMTNNKLEIQFKLLSNSNKGMIYSPHVKAIQNEKGEWSQADVIMYYYPLPNTKRYDQWLIRGGCMITQSCLFDKNIFREVGFWRTDLMPHEDLEFLFRVGKTEPYPLHTNKAAVVYRQHGLQITDLAVNNYARSVDQVNALLYIRTQMKNYSTFDKLVIEGQIYNSIKHIKKSDVYPHLNPQISLFSKLGANYLRINGKFNRMITDSLWMKLHGISKSKSKFENIIQMLNKEKLNSH